MPPPGFQAREKRFCCVPTDRFSWAELRFRSPFERRFTATGEFGIMDEIQSTERQDRSSGRFLSRGTRRLSHAIWISRRRRHYRKYGSVAAPGVGVKPRTEMADCLWLHGRGRTAGGTLFCSEGVEPLDHGAHRTYLCARDQLAGFPVGWSIYQL